MIVRQHSMTVVWQFFGAIFHFYCKLHSTPAVLPPFMVPPLIDLTYWIFHCTRTIGYCSALASLDPWSEIDKSLYFSILDRCDVIHVKFQVPISFHSEIMNISQNPKICLKMVYIEGTITHYSGLSICLSFCLSVYLSVSLSVFNCQSKTKLYLKLKQTLFLALLFLPHRCPHTGTAQI